MRDQAVRSRTGAHSVTPTDFLRIVVDRDRLALLGRAALGPFSVSEFATEQGSAPKKLLLVAAKLREAGLLNADNSLNEDVFDEIGTQLPPMESGAAPSILEGDWSDDERKVLDAFFVGTKLKAIPTHRAKRIVILERFAQEFDPGVRYDERQVSFMLQLFYSDYATLRRYLVDEDFLSRADGVYWRSGGRYSSSSGTTTASD